MTIDREHPLSVIKTPDIVESEISEQKKKLLKNFAVFIFEEVSKKHSLSYIRDIATNFDIRRGINLIKRIPRQLAAGSQIHKCMVL